MFQGEVSTRGWAGLAPCVGASGVVMGVQPRTGAWSLSSSLYELCFNLGFPLFSETLFQASSYPPRVAQWPGKSGFCSWNICELQL